MKGFDTLIGFDSPIKETPISKHELLKSGTIYEETPILTNEGNVVMLPNSGTSENLQRGLYYLDLKNEAVNSFELDRKQRYKIFRKNARQARKAERTWNRLLNKADRQTVWFYDEDGNKSYDIRVHNNAKTAYLRDIARQALDYIDKHKTLLNQYKKMTDEEILNEQLQNVKDTSIYGAIVPKLIDGFHQPQYDYIGINNKASKERLNEIVTHEIAHASEAIPQELAILKALYKGATNEKPTSYRSGVKGDYYWDDAGEINSRWAEVKNYLDTQIPKWRNMSPRKIINKVEKNPKFLFFNRYNDKTLKHIIKDVAQNQSYSNEVSFALKGTKLSNLKMEKEQDKKQTSKKGLNQRIYNYVDPTQAYPENLIDASKLLTGSLLYGGLQTYEVEDSVADAAWRKRLGLGYDSKFLPENGDGSVRLPKHLEAEIPTDTNMVKRRIAANEKLLEYYNTKRPDVITNKDIVGKVLELDKQTLDSLRHTYKTGEPVVINENAHNNRQLMKDGSLELGLTPLNVLGNFTIKWNPETLQMEYFDKYDFNQFEWGVPGKPFEIKGTITPKPALKSKKK